MPQGSPISDIMQMRQQGLSNNQVIQNLQRQGYSNTQIFDAMSQADTKMAVEGMQPFPVHNEVMFSQPPQDTFTTQTSANSPEQAPAENRVKVEELVEAVIEEKWEELLKDVNKIVTWKNKVESRLSEIEVNLQHVKESLAELQGAIIGKVNEYDRHILEVGSEVKAMEKVFSKVLPMFAENVNELANIANKLREVEK